jgi:VWFA-related protein
VLAAILSGVWWEFPKPLPGTIGRIGYFPTQRGRSKNKTSCDTIISLMRNRASTRARLLVCFWITLTATSTPAGSVYDTLSRTYKAQEVQSRIRVQTEEVLVPVTVSDKDGELVWDLTQRDFHVFDNGVEQEITHWDFGGMPLSVALVIETSSHNIMTALTIRSIASIFTENILAAEGEGAVITYSAEVQIRQAFTQDHDLIERVIKGVEFGPSEMKLYDAMHVAVRLLAGQRDNGRRVMLVVGESQDSTSQAKLKDVIREAAINNILIYSVGPSSTWADLRYGTTGQGGMNLPPLPLPKPLPPVSTTDPPATPIGRQRLDVGTPLLWLIERGSNALRNIRLEHAVEATGGMHYRTFHNKTIPTALEKIGGELHAQYLVAYKPNSNGPLTGFHEINVTLSRKDLTARARPGYFVPPLTP